MTIDSDVLDTGVSTTVTEIIDQYTDSSDVLNAMYGNLSGLDIDADTAAVLTSCAVNDTAQWDALYAADPSAYSQGAIRDFVADITAQSLTAQQNLALAITTTLRDTVAVGGTVQDALVSYMDGVPVGAYVDKTTGSVVLSETTLSSTTYIPIGEYLAGAGKAVEAFAIYETFKDTVDDAYHATLGDEQAAFDAEKDYLVASSATIAGGSAAARVPIGGEAGQALLFAGVGGIAAWAADTLATNLGSIVHDAKVEGKTEAETLAIVQGEINDTINGAWSATGTAATNMLDTISGLLGNMYSAVQGLVSGPEAPEWCPNPPLPASIASALGQFGTAEVQTSPLVIDLSSGHTGIQLTTFNAATTTTFFDIEGTGYASQTAWTSGSTTGFLVDDLNSNGKIDSVNEMFGSSTVDGFAKLAALDSNHDLKIDSSDADWSSLQVWIDANGNGVTDVGELHSLSSLGIVSIDLAGVTGSATTLDGNTISHTSAVTFTGGATAAIDDVWFTHSTTNTVYNGDYTLDPDTLFLPDLRGYGTLPDLDIAMSQDATLKGLVETFVSDFSSTGFTAATIDGDAASILYRWAGVEGIDPDSRGAYVNAQQLGFLEHLFDQSFVQINSNDTTDPMPAAATQINLAWDSVFENFESDLILQAGGSALFVNPVTYNPWTGTTSGDTTLSETAIDNLATNAPSDPTANIAYWMSVGHFLESVVGLDNINSTEATWLDSTIYSTNHDLGWDAIVTNLGGTITYNTIISTVANDTITGTDGPDQIVAAGGSATVHGGGGDDVISASAGHNVLYGDAGNDTLSAGIYGDMLYGGDGNDTLYGSAGDDTLSGGSGGNYLYGGGGNDTYIYGGGADFINENNNGGTDKIVMPSGITLSDLTFTRVETGDLSSYNDLLITINGSGSIQIYDQFDPSTGYHVESIVFNDGSTLDLSTISPSDAYMDNAGSVFQWASSSPIFVHGGSGNDTISMISSTANNTIDGGAGNDTISAGSGNDTIIASAGYDTVTDAGGTDTIVIPAAFTESDVSFLHPGSGQSLIITIAGLGEIDLSSQFYNSGSAIENLHFLSDNSTVAIADEIVHAVGTSGGDYLYGPTFGVAGTIFDGRGGSDNFIGGVGNNTFNFSPGFGNDYIQETSTAGTNTVHFSGIDPSDIRMFTDAYGNLHLQDTSDPSHNITVDAGTTGSGNGETNVGQYLSQVTFDDVGHTVWSLTGGLTLTGDNSGDALYGSAYGDTITGGSGNDYIYANGGNDTLIGGSGSDNLYGGTGNDTYVFTSGFGNSIVSESLGQGSDTIHFSGIDPSDIRMWTDSSGNLHLQDTSDPSHNITVDGGTTGSGSAETAIGLYVEQITFDDPAHTVWDLTQGLTLTADNAGDGIYGTAYADTIIGGSGSDYLYGNGGDDTLIGGGGYNYLDGGTGTNTVDYSHAPAAVTVDLSSGSTSNNGAGSYDTLANIQNVTGSGYNDTITGDSHDNVLYGAGGNDVLTGGLGADTFLFKAATAFTGSATITDFSTSQNDKIDISDVLHGHYDPLTNAISDFVQLTTSGSNTILKVDIDGTGTGHTPTAIATIQGVTGLDLATLISDHHLIVS